MIAAMPAIVAAAPDGALRRAGRDAPESRRARGRGVSRPAEGAGRRAGRRRRTCASSMRSSSMTTCSTICRPPTSTRRRTRNPAQITSGTLSYAVGVGKAVVSTPYVHATEILADGHGVLVDFGDSAAFAREINALLGNRAQPRAAVGARLCARPDDDLAAPGRDARSAQIERHRRRAAAPPGQVAHAARPLTPDIAAVERMSDCDRHAAALDLFGPRSPPRLLHRRQCPRADADDADRRHRRGDARQVDQRSMRAFVQYAWNPDARRFRNFMNFDRTWCEDIGSEDSNGRALWALGVTARDADACTSIATGRRGCSTRPPAWRSTSAARARTPSRCSARRRCSRRIRGMRCRARSSTRFGDELVALLDARAGPNGRWFEIVLAYDNARLPEALIRAGHGARPRRPDRGRARDARLDRRAPDLARGPLPRGRHRKLRPRLCRAAAVRPAAAGGAGDGRRLRRRVRRDRRPCAGSTRRTAPIAGIWAATISTCRSPTRCRRRLFRRAACRPGSTATRVPSRFWRCNLAAVRFRPFQSVRETVAGQRARRGLILSGVARRQPLRRRGDACSSCLPIALRLHADPSRVVVRPFHIAWAGANGGTPTPHRAAGARSARDEPGRGARPARGRAQGFRGAPLADAARVHDALRRDRGGCSGSTAREIGDEKRQLIGAYFCHEYSYAAAALMNPSVVPHFDQSGMPAGIAAHPDVDARGGRGAHHLGRVPRRHHHRPERAEAGARAAVRHRRRRGRRRGRDARGAGHRLSPPRFDAVGHGHLPDHRAAVEGAGGSAPRPVHA